MKKSQTKKFKTYRLYAAFPTQENVEKAAGSRFQRVTSRYILRYTDKHLEKPWDGSAGGRPEAADRPGRGLAMGLREGAGGGNTGQATGREWT